MNLDEFIAEAKTNTYASQREGGESVLEDGSKELIYSKDSFKYRDRYSGYNSFSGQEVVWQDGQTVWSMNYYGRVISPSLSAKKVYIFLKQALRLVKKDKPFRGPTEFTLDNFKYFNKSQGNLKNFTGEEKIFYNGEEVYNLNYDGGKIK